MFIDSLRLRNWFRFKDLSVEFGNMTAIRGPNGAGKTSLVQAIPFALTGDAGLDGDTNDHVCQFAVADEPAFVGLKFHHGGASCELRREISHGPHRAGVHLKILGGDTISGDANVRAKLFEMLQVDDRLLREYVFVPQWGMFSFLTQKAADRAKAFAKLFGTGKAETIWKALGDVSLSTVVISVDKKSVLNRLSETDELIKKTTVEINAATAKVNGLNLTATVRQSKIAGFRESVSLNNELLACDRRILDTEQQLTAAAGRIAAITKIIDPLINRRDFLQKREEFCRLTVSCWSRYRNNKQTIDKLSASQSKVSSDIQAHKSREPVKPEKHLSGDLKQSVNEQIASISSTLVTVQRFLQSCDPDLGIAACPTCGTSTKQADLSEQIVKAKATYSALSTKLTDLKELANTSNWYDTIYEKWSFEMELLQKSLQSTAAIIAPLLKETVEPREDLSLAEAELSELAKLQKELPGIDSGLRAESFIKSSASGQLIELKRRRDEIIDRLKALTPINAEEYKALLLEDKAVQDISAAIFTNEMYLKSLQRTQVECDGLLKRHQEEMRKFQVVQSTDEHLKAVRNLYHRNNLPAKVSQFFLHTIKSGNRDVPGINDFLEMFDSPFRVDDVADLQLVVKFHDNRRGPANVMLSGGQKMVLAIAFRVVVSLLFAGDLGVLCLDEPTVGLDADNIKCVELALNNLRGFSKSRGLQFILITHEAGLDNLCDRVVTISNTGVAS